MVFLTLRINELGKPGEKREIRRSVLAMALDADPDWASNKDRDTSEPTVGKYQMRERERVLCFS